jgi:hypothetical protein
VRSCLDSARDVEAHTPEAIPEPGRLNTTTTWHWCTECNLERAQYRRAFYY